MRAVYVCVLLLSMEAFALLPFAAAWTAVCLVSDGNSTHYVVYSSCSVTLCESTQKLACIE